ETWALFGFGYEFENAPQVLRDSFLRSTRAFHATQLATIAGIAAAFWGFGVALTAKLKKRDNSAVWMLLPFALSGYAFLHIFSAQYRSIISLSNMVWLFPWMALAVGYGIVKLPAVVRWAALLVFWLAVPYYSTAVLVDGEGSGSAFNTLSAYMQPNDYACVYDDSVTRILHPDLPLLIPPAASVSSLAVSEYFTDPQNWPPGRILRMHEEQMPFLLSIASQGDYYKGRNVWILETQRAARYHHGEMVFEVITDRYMSRPEMKGRVFTKDCGREHLWLLMMP
ncbi:hypothetical protein IJT17_06170, partial [bacterium]|nr:hypothetical protein [bacterium]